MQVNETNKRSAKQVTTLFLALCFAIPCLANSRLIEITADRDSRYRMPGHSKPAITALPGEELLLRITAVKASSQNRDGSIHGFTLLRSKDHSKVPGWDFLLKPGTQEISVRAPLEPGEYEVVCTVICSQDHEGMHMKFVVLPGATSGLTATFANEKNAPGAGSTQTFRGEIADTQCALNVHSLTRSHEEMIKAKQMGTDAASCARYCVRNMGGSFVLLASKDLVYRLDNQALAETLSGRRVRITGTLDHGAIHVLTIAAE